MEERELSVLRVEEEGHHPRALVFAGRAARSTSLAAAKRTRFIQNLKSNYQRLKEALDFVEHFAVVCQLSEARIDGIRKARDQALQELASQFSERLKIYDERIQGEIS